MRLRPLFPHFFFRRSWNGLYKFVAVPDLQEGVQGVDVDQVTASLLATAEDLVGNRDDAFEIVRLTQSPPPRSFITERSSVGRGI